VIRKKAGHSKCELLIAEWEISSKLKAPAYAEAQSGLRPKVEKLFEILSKNPFQTPPPFEKLIGDLSGAYSRRITIQHRLVYQVLQEIKTVKVIRIWTHYE
jgi:toxin YoeB